MALNHSQYIIRCLPAQEIENTVGNSIQQNINSILGLGHIENHTTIEQVMSD